MTESARPSREADPDSAPRLHASWRAALLTPADPMAHPVDEVVLFRFEQKPGKPLARIPMVLRLKLDACRVKLHFRGWARLSQAQRWQLVRHRFATEDERLRCAALICALGGEHAAPMDTEARPILPPEIAALPEKVVRQFLHHCLTPPSQEKWAGLTDLQRYALFKLSKEGREHRLFAAAAAEFGLGELRRVA